MLTRWNHFRNLGRLGSADAEPFESLDELRREMNRLLFDFERGFPASALETGELPRISLEDAGAEFVIRAELPGMNEKDLELSVDERTVTIKGQRNDDVPEGYSVHRKERTAYRFARSLSLQTKVDANAVQASLKNGVLTVTLPKAKEAQPRKIDVQAS